jgi:formylglycine-generating enzyme required for sulfatase activity
MRSYRSVSSVGPLYDMLGNVLEWCQDGFRGYTADATVDPIKPTAAGADHVIRGGGWLHPAQLVRAASRHPFVRPGFPLGLFGFRCASSGPSE